MKKTRFLAGLLCIMMIFTMVPMITNATISDSLYDQIGGLMGRNSSRAVENATWKSMNLDFTNNFSDTTNVKTTNASGTAVDFTEGGFAYDNNNGLTSAKGDYMVWRYFPAGLESQGWSPLVFGAYYLRFKLEEGGILEPQACAYYNHARSFVQLSNTGVTVWSNKNNDGCGADSNDRGTIANTNNYAPGTDWNQMVVVANGGSGNSANGYSVYMKKDSDAEFTLVASTNGYRGGGAWKSTGFCLGGSGYAVSDAVMLEGSDEKLNVPPVPAPEVPYTAVGEVLGYESSEVHPGVENTWGAMDVDFTAENVASTEGLVIGDGITFDTTYGATVPAGTGVNLNYSAPVKYQNKWSPMFLGTMGFSFKMTDTGAINASACTGWDVNRVFMDITKDSITFAGSTKTIDNEFVPGTDWNDLLVVMGSTVGATDVSYYVYAKKATDASYTKIATVTAARTGGSGLLNAGQGAVVYGQGFSMGYLKSFRATGDPLLNEEQNIPNPGVTLGLTKAIGKVLGGTNAVPATSSADWPTTNLVFNENFDAAQGGITTPEGVTYTENGMNFPASDVTWIYRPDCNYNGWSPLCISGNYTFGFRLREDGILQNDTVKVWGNSRVYIEFTTTGVTVYNGGENDGDGQAATENFVDYVPGTDWNDVVVVADPNGGYDVYMKKANDKKFTHVASAPTYRSGGAWTSNGLRFTGKNAYVNYATSYIPITEPEMVITDKNGIDVTTVQADQLDLSSLSATILPNPDEARVLFWGIYGENGNLVDITRHDIPAGETKSTFTCNPFEKANKIRKIKAFLWNDTENITPVTNVIEVKGNAYSLEDDWTFGGKASVDGNTLVLDSVSGVESFVEHETNIGSQFDITWNMNVEQFGEEENAQIYTGANRILLDINADGVTYNTESGTAKLPWIVGNGNHNYRVIGNGNSALLYIDGFFVGELTNLEKNLETAKIRFCNKGASSMEISDVSFGNYSASNIPAQGFQDEFNNGDLCGWSNAGTEFTITKNDVSNTFTKQWVNSKNGNLIVEDYHLAQNPNACVTSSSKNITEVGDEFVIQTKIRFSSWGTESYMVTEVGGKRLTLDFREKYFSVGVDKGYSTEISDAFLLGTTDYHTLTIETYNRKNNARIYLDGKLVQDTPLATSTSGLDRVYFQANGGWYLPATMEIEYFKYSPKYYNLTVNAPSNGAEYFVGESVELSASEHSQFILNGVAIANGTSATLEDLSAGNYQLVAKSGNSISETIQFTVKENASATIQASQTGTSITASLGSVRGFDSVARVSYRLDGNVVGETTTNPYEVTIPDVSAESHILEAVAYDKNGIVIARFSKELPAVISENITTAFANEISYTIPTSGGTVEIMNGVHRLYMQHKANGITYTTASGRKVYAKGTGNFRVLTDGPFAEVYRNGQYVFGFIMPKTTEIGTSFSSGITETSVVVPEERQNFFVARDLNVQNEVYEIANLTHNHNLDFIASPEDEVRLVLNDGYYRNDISLKNGKIYVWEAEKNNSAAKEKEVMKMPSGDTHYRIETVVGMSRLYVDGKWAYTFRNGVVAGKDGVLAVNVTGGNGLSYLTVNHSQDLYLLNDTFDQSGEFVSADYWMSSNGMTTTQNEEDLLLTSTAQNGIAELSSSVGNASLTAHLTVTPETQGFWFVANHAVTNSYTKAGYNFNTGKFEIVDVINGMEVAKVTQSGTLSAGVRVLMKLVVEDTLNGKVVSLYVDGNKVISKNDSLQARGRLGFMVANGKVSLGYVVYRGDAKPMPDMRDNPILKGSTTLDMIETEDKTYLFNSMGGAYTTTDGGKTWEEYVVEAGQGLSTETGVGVTENMVRLQNGELISMVPVVPPSWWDEYGQRRGQIRPYVSTDDGMNWTHIGTQPFPPEVSEETLDSLPLQGRGATVNAISQGPSGRVYFVYGGGNSEDYGFSEVWMSDNNGRSWFKSMTPIDALQTGYVIAEAKVIETTKNTRFYFRTDKGQICYYESYDYGETWDMVPHTTPFISAMTCFSVEADPEDSDTLYIGWAYDTVNLYARPQFSRTRWAVAKSTDAGVTWEMVGTVHENNSVEHNMMNLNINVSKDYVYLNAFSSDNYGATLPWSSRIVSFPKDKQRTSPRLEQLHIMYPSQIENAVILPQEQEEQTLAIHPDSGTVTMKGQLIRNGAKDEYVLLDIALVFLGATVVETDNKAVSLKVGDITVAFGSSAVKVVDGKMYLKISTFADKFNLSLIDADGTFLLSSQSAWSDRQKSSLRYATDLFATMP